MEILSEGENILSGGGENLFEDENILFEKGEIAVRTGQTLFEEGEIAIRTGRILFAGKKSLFGRVILCSGGSKSVRAGDIGFERATIVHLRGTGGYAVPCLNIRSNDPYGFSKAGSIMLHLSGKEQGRYAAAPVLHTARNKEAGFSLPLVFIVAARFAQLKRFVNSMWE